MGRLFQLCCCMGPRARVPAAPLPAGACPRGRSQPINTRAAPFVYQQNAAGKRRKSNPDRIEGGAATKEAKLDLAERWRDLDPKLLPLDRTDIAILSILVGNSRETYIRIAEQLGITEATVRRRVRALMEKGLILGFTTRVNFSAVESTVRAFVHLQVRPDRMDVVLDGLRRHPRVAAVHRVTGPHNLLLVGLFVSAVELQDFVDDFLRMEGISDTEVQIVMRSHKEELWGGV